MHIANTYRVRGNRLVRDIAALLGAAVSSWMPWGSLQPDSSTTLKPFLFRYSACLRLLPSRRVWCGLCLWAALLGGLGMRPAGASPPAASQAERLTPVDVGVLVNPIAADSARVGIAFHQRVPHAQVQAALARLAQTPGWTLSQIQIVDDRINRDPLTTTAAFVVQNAPQTLGSAPNLWPYLRAFQRWNRVEVLFLGMDFRPYTGIEQWDHPALSVRLLQQGQGIYRYQADIRDHQRALPALPVAAATTNDAVAGPEGTPAETARAGKRADLGAYWSAVLVLAGLGLLCGAAALLWAARRPAVHPSAGSFGPKV